MIGTYTRKLALVLPRSLRDSLKSIVRNGRGRTPGSGSVRFGDFRTLDPIDRDFGYQRGLPIDRYYIENFLRKYSNEIKGVVLEIGEDTYTRKFGSDVQHSDVLHVCEGNPKATIVADLTSAQNIEADRYDCIIITQTIHLIYELKAVAETLNRILKKDGLLLVTVPGISQVKKCEWGDDWNWAFTAQSLRHLFEDKFISSEMVLTSHGNVLVAMAFLHGLAREELSKKELDFVDEEYQVLLTLAIRNRAD